jgi:hypothetical protein
MLQRTRSLRLASIVGCLLICGSICFAAKPKAAPKHAGGKPAPHKSGSKPKAPNPHEHGNAEQAGSKKGNKEKGAGNEEHNKKELAKEHGNAKEADPKHASKGKEAGKKEHKNELAKADEHHEGIHHPEDGGNKTIVNQTVNKTIGGPVTGGPGGGVTGGDAGGAAPDAMPNAGSPSLSGRPPLLFNFNESQGDRYEKAARRKRMSREEWIRATLDAAAG